MAPTEDQVVDDLRKLNDIARTLNRAVDVQSALNESLVQLVELMGLETGWVFVHDPQSEERWAGRSFRLVAWHGLPPALRLDNPHAWDKGCSCQTACKKGELQAAYNEIHCSRLAESAEAGGDRRGLAVHASTPLQAGEQVLGIVNVAAPSWSAFDERALALLTAVGQQMGVAVERARLYDALQEQRVLEQASLLDFARQLLGQIRLHDLVSFVVREVRALVDVEASALLLRDPLEPAELRFRATSGWRDDPVTHERRLPGAVGSPAGEALHNRSPVELSADALRELNEQFPWLAAEAFQEGVMVPLLAEERAIGVLAVHNRASRALPEGHIRFLQLMASQMALAIEQARLREQEVAQQQLERELAVGRQIQESMLPKSCPHLPGYDVAAGYCAAREVGGDFYDFFALDATGKHWGFIIADVAGKGVPAALFMVLSRTVIRIVAEAGAGPAEVLRRANAHLFRDNQADMFITAFYGTLRAGAARFDFCNAGHNPPLLWKAAAAELHELSTRGIVLGVLDEVSLGQAAVTLTPGDVLIFYTDGVTEAMNVQQEEFGMARLRSVLTGALAERSELASDQLVDIILDAVRAFSADVPQFDDITLLIVKYVGDENA